MGFLDFLYRKNTTQFYGAPYFTPTKTLRNYFGDPISLGMTVYLKCHAEIVEASPVHFSSVYKNLHNRQAVTVPRRVQKRETGMA